MRTVKLGKQYSALVLLIIIAVQSAVILGLAYKYYILSQDYASLQDEYEELQSRYQHLLNESFFPLNPVFGFYDVYMPPQYSSDPIVISENRKIKYYMFLRGYGNITGENAIEVKPLPNFQQKYRAEVLVYEVSLGWSFNETFTANISVNFTLVVYADDLNMTLNASFSILRRNYVLSELHYVGWRLGGLVSFIMYVPKIVRMVENQTSSDQIQVGLRIQITMDMASSDEFIHFEHMMDMFFLTAYM